MSVYGDHHYRKRTAALRRRVETEALPCWICHQAIDLTLDYKDPMSFTADHIEPLARGGKMLGELKPAHRACNSRRGAGKEFKRFHKPKRTRNWYE